MDRVRMMVRGGRMVGNDIGVEVEVRSGGIGVEIEARGGMMDAIGGIGIGEIVKEAVIVGTEIGRGIDGHGMIMAIGLEGEEVSVDISMA